MYITGISEAISSSIKCGCVKKSLSDNVYPREKIYESDAAELPSGEKAFSYKSISFLILSKYGVVFRSYPCNDMWLGLALFQRT